MMIRPLNTPNPMTIQKEPKMTNALSLSARLACTLTVAGFLAACSQNTEVRNGPQDVHPSPSELAKVPLHPCGTEGQPACA